MTDEELRELLSDGGMKLLALEACVLALARDRLADLDAHGRAAKRMELAAYARDHIETVDLTPGGQPRPQHDIARKEAVRMAEELLARLG